MRTLVILGALAFVATGAVARAQTASPAPSPAASSGATTSAKIVVHTAQFKYNPNPVTIHVGDTVTFVNDDDVAHTVTARDKSFDSGNMDKNATFTHTFATAGTYEYYCAYHSYMVAKVVVQPAAAK